MHHFFIPAKNIKDGKAELPAETANQIRKVLRLKDGQTICLLDNSGSAYEAEIEYSGDKSICGHILQSYPVETEPKCFLTVYLALTRREKFEWMLQKCTEAGASAFVPVFSERSLVRNDKDIFSKIPRWQKIIQEAAEQSGRGIIPKLHDPAAFSDAVQNNITDQCRLFFWEEEHHLTLQEALKPVKAGLTSASLIVGPEGGFSAGEAGSAAVHGWLAVTLGKRIFRVETAAIASVILTLYELERID
ncbi:MAG: 16S rRNA (uracil(1498)-N(3))-methyltransferase [Flexilinea sp.]